MVIFAKIVVGFVLLANFAKKYPPRIRVLYTLLNITCKLLRA